ncbi:MAG TPA: peptide-methionine (R)-S-oxide reductase MsrB [Candidatus Omnitrophota bacterium]|nr:peptide-methionine (R)-S-oxide reductase MsrB [Candidatus Omnitrophota bacterium]
MKKEMKENDLRKKLGEERYHILREKGTEAPFTGKLLYNDKNGKYACGVCGNVIFDSRTKFDSGCGWPSFYDAKKGSVKIKIDLSHGMIRREVLCSRCGSHLGHIFNDAPQTPTGKRFCINSLALDFKGEKNK